MPQGASAASRGTPAGEPIASARVRTGDLVSVRRNVVVVVPALGALFAASLGVGLAFESPQVTVGILVLLVVPVLWASMRYAARRDFERDAANPRVRLEPEALVVPFEGGERRLPRAGLAMASGFFDRRFRGRNIRVVDDRIGVFLFLRHDEFEVVLLACDHLRDARQWGLKRYADAPDDTPQVPVWSQELLPLIRALGAVPRRSEVT